MMEQQLAALKEAARNNDAIAEEHGLVEAAKRIGIDLEALMHVADQRALRATIAMSRGEKAMRSFAASKVTFVPMNPDELALHQTLTAVFMDGITLGWRAKEIHEADNGQS